MPSTLGEVDLSLPTDVRQRLATLAAWGQTLDSSAQAYTDEVQKGVRTILGAGAAFEERWRLICRSVLEGQTVEMQSVRDRFLRAFEDRLQLLSEARALVQLAERVAQRELPEAAQLREEAESLERKLKQLSARWQTVEDLEDLAAESIATFRGEAGGSSPRVRLPAGVVRRQKQTIVKGCSCRGRVIWVTIPDPQRRNPKHRPAVILTFTEKITPDGDV